MRKLLPLLILTLCLPLCAQAEPAWTAAPDSLRPGKAVQLTFSAGDDAVVTLLDEGRAPVMTLMEAEGRQAFFWDGCDGGEPLPQGDYTLLLESGGESAEHPLLIGAPAPAILGFMPDDICSGDWRAWVETSMAGTLEMTLHQGDEDVVVLRRQCDRGEQYLSWDGLHEQRKIPEGEWSLTLRLMDSEGFSSNPESFSLTMDWPSLATDVEYHTPSDGSPIQCDHDPCYWNMNMGEMDEAAIWEILTQPVTVVRGKQREMVKLRAEPKEGCTDYVGEVTCDSQAVHILKQEGDWTLIEVYSSSASGSRVKVWALKCQGWIKTSLLEQREVDQEYGIVIDKLQQRLYLFKDGRLYTTLLCSTGFPTKTDPFNETPAGEFLIVSWTGGFWSETLYCDYALRINAGILIHEVPCFPIYDPADPTKMVDKDFANFEGYLGEKASHGCIRVQRRKTPEGVNMYWLWNNLNRKQDTKVIIWDEVGRTLGYPDNAVTLYYNPNGGRNYHSAPTCQEVNEKYWPLSPFFYGDLESDEFSSLKRCKACAPQLRMAEIDNLNAENHR